MINYAGYNSNKYDFEPYDSFRRFCILFSIGNKKGKK